MADSKSPAVVNRYYPSPQKTGAMHEDFRLLFDHVYTLMDRQRDLQSHVQKQQEAAKGAGLKGKPKSPAEPNGPSNTKIAGLNVKAVPPVHGATPFYNQSTGQLEFSTAAGAVTPPTSSNSSGQPGQIAHDGTSIYVCTAANTWKKAALTTF